MLTTLYGNVIDPSVCILINKVHYIHGQICATDDHVYQVVRLPGIHTIDTTLYLLQQQQSAAINSQNIIKDTFCPLKAA